MGVDRESWDKEDAKIVAETIMEALRTQQEALRVLLEMMRDQGESIQKIQEQLQTIESKSFPGFA